MMSFDLTNEIKKGDSFASHVHEYQAAGEGLEKLTSSSE